jgi:hypothetical protein
MAGHRGRPAADAVTLRLDVLGPVRLLVDGEPVEAGGRVVPTDGLFACQQSR